MVVDVGGGHNCFKDSDKARMRSRNKMLWEKAVDIEELCGPGETWWGVIRYMHDNFNHSNRRILCYTPPIKMVLA